MLDITRSAVHDEATAISEFITRHGWKMEMTGTGLRYEIYQKGKGARADASHLLTISYKVFLLDGTLCYESDETHPLKLIVGRGQQINGLEQGLMLMNEGDRARFVIPNHLAFGVTGDQDKIPPASALYYDVHLIRSEPLK
jgi:FKBP-type peptidyl-prolyl cis-trans isomerase